MSRTQAKPVTIRPTPEELLPLYPELFSRSRWPQFVQATKVRLDGRLWTPLMIVWALRFQRWNADHTGDAVVSDWHTGAVDPLAPSRRHSAPWSQRLTSESHAASVPGRNR